MTPLICGRKYTLPGSGYSDFRHIVPRIFSDPTKACIAQCTGIFFRAEDMPKCFEKAKPEPEPLRR